ncbi:MAG: hypothetical protein K6E34_14075, partial [Lachnospiraceae bacterium]|nr:hypothetical protein [Lachnospiraceae bacterium]
MKRILLWIALFLVSAAACHGIFLGTGYFTGEFSGMYIMVAGCTAFAASVVLFRIIISLAPECMSGVKEDHGKTRARRRWADATMDMVDLMDGIEFEDWCADLLIANGFTHVTGTP